jgi:DNA-binding NarL/FixJ family response regulator
MTHPFPDDEPRLPGGGLTVLVADDHPVFRGGLRAMLASTDAIEVIGEVATGREAVEQAVARRPDVVVMDLHMPGELNGVAATRELTLRAADVRVLVLTMSDDDESVLAAMRAGASGYVLKDAEQHDVVRSIVAVARGDVVFGPAVAQRMRTFLAGEAPPTSPFPQLTEREAEVLDLVAAGHDNQAIARRLGVASKTVRNTVSNIFLKLQVADRPQAIIRAREAGMGRGSGPGGGPGSPPRGRG